jgi:hypothetical protein
MENCWMEGDVKLGGVIPGVGFSRIFFGESFILPHTTTWNHGFYGLNRFSRIFLGNHSYFLTRQLGITDFTD